MVVPASLSLSATGPVADLLFAHGARDPRWSEPLHRLRALLQARDPARRVALAYLELQAPALPDALDELAAAGVRAIRVLPVFWSLGAHTARDLPALIGQFQARHPGVAVQVLPVLSELPGLLEFLGDAWRSDAAGGGDRGHTG